MKKSQGFSTSFQLEEKIMLSFVLQCANVSEDQNKANSWPQIKHTWTKALNILNFEVDFVFLRHNDIWYISIFYWFYSLQN